ncbi:unnamed protein product [Thlaspi arvense]|uniref:Calmodulin-binding domain-containing protein n=1 Tax=Thlaspi arvense TaxID=13288 RepID=A0AAU9SWZ6_THLAR|nr:unnamed protein product [Thlaspi arvense]
MAEENTPQADEKCCLDDAKPMETIEDPYVVTMPLMDEKVQRDDVLLPPAAGSNGIVNPRRYSTGVLDKRGAGKAQIQTRYRGNQMSSTHDLCKHGKRREDDVVVKPWKLVKKKNVEGGDLVKGETLGVMRKSFGNVSKHEEKSLQVAKRDAAAVSEIVKSCDGFPAKRSVTKSTITPSDSAGVLRMVKKTELDVKKVSRISESKSSKEDLLKHLKSKEKKTKMDEPVKCEDASEKRVSRISENKSPKEGLLKSMKVKEKTTEIDEPVLCEDVSEKTLCVAASSTEEKKMKKKKSIKSVKSEIQQSSEKNILRGSGKKSLTLLPSLSPSSEEVKESRVTRSDPSPIRQTTSRSKTGLYEKKEIPSATLVAISKTESKIRPKKIGLKVTPPPGPPTKPLSFKKGKVLEPKPEGSTPTLLKFKKRVVQEPKLKSDGNKKKKNLKDKREGVGKMSNNNGEGKREKVVLRHRKVEAKKKLQTLFNNVIEETVNKLEEVRKSKVKALVGAFETVISLQDNDRASQNKKIQGKSASSPVVEG